MATLINIWHILIFLTFNTLTLFAAFYSGFYFGHKPGGISPVRKIANTFGGIVETVTAPKKTPGEVIEEHKANAFYD